MAVFRKLKNIFGFSDEEYDQTTENEEPEVKTPYINPFKKQEEENKSEKTTATQIDKAEFEASLNTEVTSKIIEVLNSGLPDFIKGCVDIEAERAYIQKIFGDVLQKYSNDLQLQMDANAKSQWQSDRINLENEIAKQKQQISEIAEKYATVKQRNISLENQKSSQTERINDLEKKASTAEAERDQFELEAKSLMNKLKVSSVNGDNLNALKEENSKLQGENNTLRAEILKLKNAPASKALTDEQQKENDAVIAELNAQINQSAAKIEALNAQITQLNEEKQNDKTADNITDLQKQIADLTDELYKVKEERNQIKESASNDKSQIETLTNEVSAKETAIKELNQTLAELQGKLTEQNNNVSLIGEKDEALATKDKSIAQLNQTITGLKQELEDLTATNKTLTEKQDATILEKDETIQKLNTTITKLQEELKEQAVNADLVVEKEKDIEEKNKTIAHNEEEIKDFKSQAKEDSLTIRSKEAEILTLKGKISTMDDLNKQLQAKIDNLENNQDAENVKLRQEIELLRVEKEQIKKSKSSRREAPSLFFNDEEEEVVTKPKKKPKTKTISAIDYNSDSTDWLMPTPPTTDIPIQAEDEPKKDDKADDNNDNKFYTMSLF